MQSFGHQQAHSHDHDHDQAHCIRRVRDSWGPADDAGIIAEEIVEAMPPELEALSDRLVRWGIIPPHLRPNSAIINVYEPGDCIPPHIDHHDFVRPFVTLSLLSEQPIMFGQRLIPLSPGNFGGSDYFIPLPQGDTLSACHAVMECDLCLSACKRCIAQSWLGCIKT